MKIQIYGANTGNGHLSVLHAIESSFSEFHVNTEVFPEFYENLMESNRIISDFYNLVQQRSTKLCVILSELMVLEGKRQKERLYKAYSKAFQRTIDGNIDVIISVTPLINQHLIRYIKDKNLNIKFYIVVTDPYHPLYPGFDVIGAEKYFCANEIVQKQLVEKGINSEKICITGYPVHSKFFSITKSKAEICFELGIHSQFIILINCGANGNMNYFPIIRAIMQQIAVNCHFIIVCGRNDALFTMVSEYLNEYSNVTILGFVDNIHELLYISDICITKPGASTIYEALVSKTLPIIIDYDGRVYQERGVHDFLQSQYDIGLHFDHLEDMIRHLNNNLSADFITRTMAKVNQECFQNGSKMIAWFVLQDMQR